LVSLALIVLSSAFDIKVYLITKYQVPHTEPYGNINYIDLRYQWIQGDLKGLEVAKIERGNCE